MATGTRGKALTAVLLWVVLAVPVLWAGFTSRMAHPLSWWGALTCLAVIGAGVALGRRHPLVALLLGSGLWLVEVMRGNPFTVFAALVAFCYLAGVRMDRAGRAVAALGGLLVLAGTVTPLVRDAGAGFVAVAGAVLGAVVPWLAGRARRQYVLLAREGWERAEELERAQRVIAEQARARERTRIAGDMHDLLGHELGLVALRIGGLEVAPGLDERYRQAAGEARRAVTAASERLQEIVDMLHRDVGSAQEESVPELVERARAAGMRVELRTVGDGPHPVAMAERALRRVVQEGLTNSAKHAPGAPVTVTVEHLHSETVVTVTTAPSLGQPGDPGSGGHGLEGLRERVRLCGGSLRAGPRSEGPDGEYGRHARKRDMGLNRKHSGYGGLAQASDAGFDGRRGGPVRERGAGFEVRARLPRVPGPIAEPDPPSISAAHLARARLRARRTRVTAIVTAVTAGAVVTLLVVAFTVYDAVTSVLTPHDFQGLRPGQDQAAVARVLPGRSRIDGPVSGEPARPPGASCRYYGTHANPFDASHSELFRLCFADGHLVSKDFLPTDRGP
ncbi:ATP-binding protein [Streptosporangium saharense]|uniref:histidine kinase n=1 Tax=Streptosporangium saharense TaxID=1706840 RepID=A0A7W7QQ06_9ACTN|nr:histidine kinase [Streptosporangium saharense]MBB4917665.1 signal transduction histidine kinase [Streptosporangium saharense]